MKVPQEVPHPRVRDLRRSRLELASAPRTDEELEPAARAAARAARRLEGAQLVDSALGELWREASVHLRSASGIALGAVGSLGRRDLGPVSDLDLLLVHDGRSHSAAEVAKVAERLWYPVWDAG